MGSMVRRAGWLAMVLLVVGCRGRAAEPVVTSGLAYKTGAQFTDYERERCKLDVWASPGLAKAPVLIWFFGGGLTQGDRGSQWTAAKARGLSRGGLVVVVPDYRLSPKVTYPAYVEDAAAAVAWSHAHAAEYGGDPDRLFIAGHSAGAWLALMVGMAPSYLKAVGVPASAVAGIVPVSGQALTMSTVRNERGLPPFTLIADDAAPLRWVSADLPPMLMLYGDHDAPARAEEVNLLAAMLRAAGHKAVTTVCVADRTHGAIADGLANEGDPARQAILDFVRAAGQVRP